MKRTRYCGGPSVGLPGWLHSSSPTHHLLSGHPQFHNRRVFGTYSGRSAIALACKLLDIGPGDDVLVPSYNCGSEIDAILHTGAKTIGYPINRRCEIDLTDLFARKTNQTKAVYVIPYFGWEPPLAELRRWCDAQGLLLIEDCALALFSNGESGKIGQLSDAAIYSLPKTLGFYHGGLLSLPASRAIEQPSLTPAGRSVLAAEIQQSTKATLFSALDQLGLYGALLSARRRRQVSEPSASAEPDDKSPDMPESYYYDPSIHAADRGAHPRTIALAKSLPWQEIVQRRRANYLRLSKALTGMEGAVPLNQALPEGVCPLSFPLLVSNRDACVDKLQSKGIAAYPWWAGFHRNGIDWTQFPDACWLKRHLLTLPIHQGLNGRQIDYQAETAASVVDQISRINPAGFDHR